MFRVFVDAFKSKERKMLDKLPEEIENEIASYVGAEVLTKKSKDDAKTALRDISVTYTVMSRRKPGTGLTFLSSIYHFIKSQIQDTPVPQGYAFDIPAPPYPAPAKVYTPGVMSQEDFNKFISIMKKLGFLFTNHLQISRWAQNRISIDERYTRDMMKLDRSKLIDFFKEGGQPLERTRI